MVNLMKPVKKNVYEKEACFWDFFFFLFTLKKNLSFYLFK